jgi:hypothetical protein
MTVLATPNIIREEFPFFAASANATDLFLVFLKMSPL